MSYDEYFSWRLTVCEDSVWIEAGLKLLTNEQLERHIETVMPYAASEMLVPESGDMFTTVLRAMQAILRKRTDETTTKVSRS